jgi:hypothetical protein
MTYGRYLQPEFSTSVGVAVVDGIVELFELMSEPCGVPTGRFACACGDLRYRNEARGSIGSGFAV